jgi:hypothetical protein
MIIKVKKNHWFNEKVEIVDDVKNVHKAIISTCQRHHYVDYEYSCFWCHCKSNAPPIHCPLKYFSAQMEKHLPLKNGEGTSCIKGNVENGNNDYYEMDGSFCSSSCCLAYIQDKQDDIRYADSQMLLYQMTGLKTITPSPSWRLLSNYGGPYSEQQFKNLIINKDTFEYHGRMLFVNHMFEKNLFQ